MVVNNPEYNNITCKIGKLREKISRRKALLFELIEDHLEEDLHHSGKYQQRQGKVRGELSELERQEKEWLQKSVNEKRALVKSIIKSPADIIPDEQNNQLTVKIYSQSSSRMNAPLQEVIQQINACQTKYPGTNLVLNFKIAT
jgi:hypothetical protein